MEYIFKYDVVCAHSQSGKNNRARDRTIISKGYIPAYWRRKEVDDQKLVKTNQLVGVFIGATRHDLGEITRKQRVSFPKSTRHLRLSSGDAIV